MNDSRILNEKLELNGKQILAMRRPNETRDGMLYYEIPRSYTAPRTKDTPMTLAWLVTYPAKLPYLPVTRKEHLSQAGQEVLEKQQQGVASMEKDAAPSRAARDRQTFYEAIKILIGNEEVTSP